MNPVIILGGGVASLSCACRLAEYGIQPLVIEKGSYPTHKVCGEFISPESIRWLKRWDINPLPISKVTFPTFSFDFPTPAGALSHLTLDLQLKELAEKRGARILTHTEVITYRLKKGGHEIDLKDLTLKTPALVIGVGRKSSLTPSYIGLKAHFENPGIKYLEMRLFPGGYFGMAPVEDNRLNVACLMKSTSDPEKTLADYLPPLRPLTPWLKAPIGTFGFKSCEDAPGTYYIGDAFATIPPASGLGMTLAILSGIKAADFLVQKDAAGFKTYQRSHFRYPMLFAKAFHHLLLSSWAHPLLPSLIPALYPYSRV